MGHQISFYCVSIQISFLSICDALIPKLYSIFWNLLSLLSSLIIFHFYRLKQVKEKNKPFSLQITFIPLFLTEKMNSQKMIDKRKDYRTCNFRMTVGLEFLQFLKEKSARMTKEDALCYLISHMVQELTIVVKNGYSFTLQPGQVMAPLLQLSKEWKWDRKSVRRFLDGLEELGYIKKIQYQYGTILEFTELLRGTSDTGVPQTVLSHESGIPDSGVQFPTDSDVLVGVQSSSLANILYEAPPLQLDEKTSKLCHKVYDLFVATFPLLPKPAPYDQRIEKDIYYVFILGMNGNLKTLQRYFDIIRNDPFRNGTMAQISPNSAYTESFQSLFSCKWQVVLSKSSPDSEKQK